MEFDYNKNPDGISESLSFLDKDEMVWDRGYYCEVENGCWYELYVTDKVKKLFPSLYDEDKDIPVPIKQFLKFRGLMLDHYEESCQITFFEPEQIQNNGYRELTDLFLQFFER
jgi:hypothetical protein